MEQPGVFGKMISSATSPLLVPVAPGGLGVLDRVNMLGLLFVDIFPVVITTNSCIHVHPVQ